MTSVETPTMRGRVVAAALELTVAEGWSAVTMSRVAERVGVSRQTVYNEVGSKPALAEAMVLTELERFLDVVVQAFDRHPRDLAAGVEAAVSGVLDLGRHSELLRAILSGADESSTGLLPPLSTDAGAVVDAARAVVVARLSAYDVDAPPRRVEAVADVLVRTVLSHVMSPSGTTARTAADLAAIAAAALDPA
ncbi:MAG: TetR family transcriptional regulator [Candidatus Nanopelagicales bacterium]